MQIIIRHVTLKEAELLFLLGLGSPLKQSENKLLDLLNSLGIEYYRKGMKSSDKIFLSLAFLLFCASVFGIYAYNKIFTLSSDKKIIARVEKASKDSLVKSPDNYEYKTLKANDPITNGDKLLSGKDSEILVKFVDGPRVSIGKESDVSLREINGQPDLKIDKGSFSGTFVKGKAIDVFTKDEVVRLNGEKDTQFSIAQKKDGDLEIGSYNKELEVEYKGKKTSLKNEKVAVSPSKGVQSNKKKSAVAKNSKPSSGGLSFDSPQDKKTGLALEAPYPKNNQIFLHKEGGTIAVFPKTKCKGACTINISLNGQKEKIKTFERNMTPVMYLKVQPQAEAKVTWTFNDGGKDINGEFEFLINNQSNFKKAFNKRLPIEVLN